jgi:integrase
MGIIYKRGHVFWIKYYRNGKPYRESAKSAKEGDAKRLLKNREGEISQGKLPGIYFDRVRFEELAEDFLRDYRLNNKTVKRAEQAINNLSASSVFAGVRVTDITTPLIERYVEERLAQGAANATINRELSSLKRAFNLGARQTPPKVNRVPYIPMLKESNTRKGFFEHGEFQALRKRLPAYLQGFVTFAYRTGWRKDEISCLKWAQVDRQNNIVSLNPGETKNDEARTVYLDGELKDVFAEQWEKRKQSKILSPFVFPSWDGVSKIKDIRKVWATACREAGISRKLFHDFRRTAVRNMVRAGIPERVAMTISGHRTRSVFDRYNIVNDSDLKQAAEKQATYLQEQEANGHNLGTIAYFETKKGLGENDLSPCNHSGGPCENRTHDQRIKSPLLYRLS